MSTKIKICGLKRQEDIEYVNIYKPDYIGFVFFPPSSRYVTKEKACELRKELSPEIIPVGVFLDNSLDEILEIVESGAIDIVQLHGKTAPDLVRALKDKISLPIMEAFTIKSNEDIEKALCSDADMILLDNGAGGTGQSFDWRLLKKLKRPYFLAGGLNPDNVVQALENKPFGVDTSSGVETNKLKDLNKIKTFIEKVRAGEETINV